MDDDLLQRICTAVGASALHHKATIQNLWSGYGTIARYALERAQRSTVIIKQVRLPERSNHPRGWNSDLSHQRKIKSYQVETNWYNEWSSRCDDSCRIPECLYLETEGDEVVMVLEDLDASGFASRLTTVGWSEIEACLSWLANFHATFMNTEPTGLWESGSYWHLQTRPDELAELEDGPLKSAAAQIDQKLTESPYQSLVHGDAKLANFCFSTDGRRVAAVDFQYVGGGCGMKDLAYFISSCLDEDECERYEERLLNIYFHKLRQALSIHNSGVDPDSLERDWRALYPIAWTDFYRFLKGWSPGHWKIHSYSERLAREVVTSITDL